MTGWGYLGPEGTFSEVALLALLAQEPVHDLLVREEHADEPELRAYPSVVAAIAGVRAGEVLGAVVPLENSVEGAVAQTLDELATGEPVAIIGEAEVPVTFVLLARPGTALEDVRTIGTHPHGEAQTRRWVAEHVPAAVVVPTASTSSAAAGLADGTASWDAALSSARAGELYGLTALASGVADNPRAATRFVLVTRPVAPPPRVGHDKTTLALFIGKDHPGALLEILTEFAVRGINLTRIESRPTGGGIGDYFFSVDCEGHVDDARVGEALVGLRRVCAEVRFLGSYPRVDQQSPQLRRGVSDGDYHEAQAWLARVRDGRP